MLRPFGVVFARGMLRQLDNRPGNVHPKGATAMHIAAQRGHVSFVKAIAELPTADQSVLQAKDTFGYTPLARARHSAAEAHVEALEPVLGGADARTKLFSV